ncbi:hypothetical protein [Nocardia sp. NPDC051832]
MTTIQWTALLVIVVEVALVLTALCWPRRRTRRRAPARARISDRPNIKAS